jgi:ribosome-binding factor A
MNPRRIQRLCSQIKARVAEVIDNEMADPRRGLITVTRVELDRELQQCTVYWSVLGGDKQRVLNERMLDHATSYMRHEIAKILRTRTVPRVRFKFDESIAGALHMDSLLAELRAEWEQREAREAAQGESDEPQPPVA